MRVGFVNADRKDFLPSEIDAIRRALVSVEKEAAKERQGARTDLAPTSGKVSHKSEPDRADRARDKIGAFAGVSGRTVEKISRVIEAAKKRAALARCSRPSRRPAAVSPCSAGSRRSLRSPRVSPLAHRATCSAANLRRRSRPTSKRPLGRAAEPRQGPLQSRGSGRDSCRRSRHSGVERLGEVAHQRRPVRLNDRAHQAVPVFGTSGPGRRSWQKRGPPAPRAYARQRPAY